jgi:hypothetical protein
VNRWRHRLDELRDEARTRPYASSHMVQNVQYVQNHLPDSRFEHSEQVEQRTEFAVAASEPAALANWPDVNEERAAITTAPGPVAITPSTEAEEGAAAKGPTLWHDQYEERAAVRQYEGGYPRAEADLLAWREVETRWQMAHGERVQRHLCAGCRRPIGGAVALDLIDGNRVHDRADNDCLIRHGERWRHRSLLLSRNRPS